MQHLLRQKTSQEQLKDAQPTLNKAVGQKKYKPIGQAAQLNNPQPHDIVNRM